MSDREKRYWKGLDELEAAEPVEARSELGIAPDAGELSVDRRDFLRLAGFAVGAGAVTACGRGPVASAIPYLHGTEDVVPGRSYWLASTCGGCPASCGLLIKCRDGRPIKIEGNPDHPVSRGGVCAAGQASLLELYDSKRPAAPRVGGQQCGWDEVDGLVRARLASCPGERIRLLTGTIHSPSARTTIESFLAAHAGARHVIYDELSSSAILDAHRVTHGARILPRYRFERAGVIVSLDADFLGTWISPVEFTRGWSEKRIPSGTPPVMSWHVQLEPRMSLTGTKADERHRILPSEVGAVLRALHARLDGQPIPPQLPFPPQVIERIASRLVGHRGASLVVSGSQRLDDQILVNLINARLGNYGSTLDMSRPSQQRQGSDADLAALVEEIGSGSVDLLIVAGVNPVFDIGGFESSYRTVPFTVAVTEALDETAVASTVVAPIPHFLESWGDAEPIAGLVSLAQPAIAPLTASRTLAESLAAWSGAPITARDAIARALPSVPLIEALHDGFIEVSRPATPISMSLTEPSSSGSEEPEEGLTLVLYPTVAIGSGRHAVNPWLQELPDPVTKITWDNYASLSPMTAADLDVVEGDIVRVRAGEGSIELPAHVQPGQHDGVVAIALGYGRRGTERFAEAGPNWILRRRTLKAGETVGRNAAPLIRRTARASLYDRSGVAVEKTGGRRPLAATQLHHSIEVPEALAARPGERRAIVEETTLAAFAADPHAGAAHEHEKADLWSGHSYPLHRWAMAIDLNACTGCSACVVSCQAENNIPVVGKDEVLRQREMHWLRIDRYYAGSSSEPDVIHQPMLCQHCTNAPCETVCPVVATVHGSEGLNQQVYNRCVGTRYCANNCPYKTRRFNWFDYPREDRLQNLSLNPDVTVRSRGVMEKCSFCVQRIEEAKIEANRLGVTLKDGDVRPACQQSCPANAIVFGDLMDPASRISRLQDDPRRFVVLGDLNVGPSVGYMRLVRHRDETAEVEHV